MKKASLFRFLIIEAFYSCFKGLSHPVIPTLFVKLNYPDYFYGVVFAATSAGMFLFSPIWGRIGDKIGHSKAYTIALPIYAASQLVFGCSTTPFMAFLTRFISGVTGGGAMVVALAYIINITSNKDRGKIMAYYTAIQTVCMSLGFFIGGLIGSISIKHVFIIQSVVLCLASLITYMFIEDPSTEHKNYEDNTLTKNFTPGTQIYSKSLIIMLAVTFLTTLSSTSFENSFNYYIKAQLNLPSTYNGVVKATTGIMGLIANFTINILLVKKTNLKRSVIVVLALCSLFPLLVTLNNHTNFFFLYSFAYFTSNAVYLPIQQVLVMDNANTKTSGAISGVFNSTMSMGMIFGSLLSGFLYSINSKLPFGLSALTFLLSAAICTFNYIDSKKLTVQ